MELPLPKDIRSGWIQRHPLVNMRFIITTSTFEQHIANIGGFEKYKPIFNFFFQPGGKTFEEFSGGKTHQEIYGFGQQILPFGHKYATSPGLPSSTGGLGGLGGFGLSGTRVGMSGEIERARLDILERMKRTTDSRAKSRLTLPKLFGDGKTEKNILADVL